MSTCEDNLHIWSTLDSSRAASISSKQTEGRGFQVLDRKQQGNGRQSLLSAGELHHVLQLLAWRLGDDRGRLPPGYPPPSTSSSVALAAAEELP